MKSKITLSKGLFMSTYSLEIENLKVEFYMNVCVEGRRDRGG